MKKIKILTIILAITLITMIGFVGIYVKDQNRMENVVKDFTLLSNLSGERTVRLKVNTESQEIIKDAEGKEVKNEEELTDEALKEKGYTKENVPNNKEEVLNKENYLKVKEIIEKRLERLNVQEYEIAVDEDNGDIVLRLPENLSTDEIISNIYSVGKFEIIDSQTKEVLINNNDIKEVKTMYGSDGTSTSTGTSVYLQIDFTKEGSKKLETISTIYKPGETSENTTSEDTNSQENEESKKEVILKIDDTEMLTTSFEEPIRTGKIQLTVGTSTTDTETLNNNISRASNIATIIGEGNLPIKYDIEDNEYILSDITEQQIQYAKIVMLAVIIVGIIILICRYKLMGLLSGISYVGLIATYLLVLKYTNVALSIEGILGIIVILILNYIFINMLLKRIKEKNKKVQAEDVKIAYREMIKEFFIKIVPICIAIVVFSFIQWTPISSFGMVMFWGIVLIALYNYIVTYNLLKIKAEK